ncbi:MAG: carboxypeptidase-like regulatory domain-containing protein [Flavobacteriales bacterium]
MKVLKFIALISLCFFSIIGNAQIQETEKDSVEEVYVQISGIIVTGKNLTPVPFVTALEKSTYRGTSSDYYGFFSFVAMPGDTIVFSCIGYKKSSYVIPDTLTDGRYSLIHTIQEDTILLAQYDVHPWPSREQFRDAFLNTDIPNDDLTRAQNNLDREILAFKQDAYPAGGSLNFKWQMQEVQSRLYYAGQAPPNNLLNPIAWSNFIKAWKNGELKRK